MRHRVDVSPQAKVMLKSICEEWGIPGMALSSVAELCIQAAYERVVEGGACDTELNPIMNKLDELHDMLQHIIPEV